MVRPAYEERPLSRSSNFTLRPTDSPAVLRCCVCGSPTGIDVRRDTVLLRKDASLQCSSLSAAAAAPSRIHSGIRLCQITSALCLERLRSRSCVFADFSAAPPLASFSACMLLAFRISRCRHSALKPCHLNSVASLSAIATLLCLPAVQLIRTVTQPLPLPFISCFSFWKVRWNLASFLSLEKKLSTISSSSPLNLSRR